MKTNDKEDVISTAISEVTNYLKKPIDLSIDPAVHPRPAPSYSQDYINFLHSKIWDDNHYTFDDMMNGVDIVNPNHMSPCAYTSLRKTIHERLNRNGPLMIELVEDCGHRLDKLERETEAHIRSRTLTGPEYIKVKRSFNVIRIIFLIVTSRLEKENDQNNPLKERTRSNLMQIVRMSSKVDKHLDLMLDNVNKDKLKANGSTWIVAGAVMIFSMVYISNFFALDKENSPMDYIGHFFGIR